MKNWMNNHPYLTTAIIGSFFVVLGVYLLYPEDVGYALIAAGAIAAILAGILGAETCD